MCVLHGDCWTAGADAVGHGAVREGGGLDDDVATPDALPGVRVEGKGPVPGGQETRGRHQGGSGNLQSENRTAVSEVIKYHPRTDRVVWGTLCSFGILPCTRVLGDKEGGTGVLCGGLTLQRRPQFTSLYVGVSTAVEAADAV